MKNIDIFVNKKYDCDTFKSKIEEYKELNKKIELCINKLNEYNELLNNDIKDTNNLSFKDQYQIYKIIEDLDRKNDNNTYLDIDLLSLKTHLNSTFKELNDYNQTKLKLKTLKDKLNNLLENEITFKKIGEGCFKKHYFVKLDNEIKCIHCGASISEYPLYKEELDFLTLCMDRQHILIKGATKEDIPLIQVLIQKQAYYRSLREPLSEDEEERLIQYEERYYEDMNEITSINEALNIAHTLDSIESRNNLKHNYYSYTKANELLLNIENTLKEVKKSNSKYKDLLIEECNTARYEVLILLGKHIPSLFNQIKNEDDKIAFVKAYYNISNEQYRCNSEYFASYIDGATYNCYTANNEINNKILEMKKIDN